MFVAPLVVVLVPVAIVLWLPTLAIVGVAWLGWWPAARFGGTRARAIHAVIGGWFRTLLTPWTYFDTPPITTAHTAASGPPQPPATDD
jgi:hypothetical protein